MKSDLEHRSQDERLSLAECLEAAFGRELPFTVEEARRHLEIQELKKQGSFE